MRSKKKVIKIIYSYWGLSRYKHLKDEYSRQGVSGVMLPELFDVTLFYTFIQRYILVLFVHTGDLSDSRPFKITEWPTLGSFC